MGVPGEDLAGVHAAKDFVGWYNGLPDNREVFGLLDSVSRADVSGKKSVWLHSSLNVNVNQIRSTILLCSGQFPLCFFFIISQFLFLV